VCAKRTSHQPPTTSQQSAVKYRVTHITTYSGSEPISVGHNQAWLKPRALPYQACESYDLLLTPQPSVLTQRDDAFGNEVATFSFNKGYTEMRVEAKSLIEARPRSTVIPVTSTWERVRESMHSHRGESELAALHFAGDSPIVFGFEEAEAYARVSFTNERPLGEAAVELMGRVFKEFKFDPHATTVSTPVTQVLEQKKGVCQDFAHVMLAMFRSLGLAARYVSGYIRTYPKPGQPRLVGADASHAWVSVYCGSDAGWLDLDPTNNLIVSDQHITLGWGRDYSDLPPLRGVFLGGGMLELEVSVDVEPLDDPQPVPLKGAKP